MTNAADCRLHSPRIGPCSREEFNLVSRHQNGLRPRQRPPSTRTSYSRFEALMNVTVPVNPSSGAGRIKRTWEPTDTSARVDSLTKLPQRCPTPPQEGIICESRLIAARLSWCRGAATLSEQYCG